LGVKIPIEIVQRTKEYFMSEKWWCNVCDSKQVDSADPKTGDFYIVFGIEYPAKEDSENTSVIFAICDTCDPKDTLRKINLENIEK
jgi:hypothetical protein